MNAKVCKLLRRAAEKVTVGKPAVQYLRATGSVHRFEIRVTEDCTRGVYRRLKRMARKGDATLKVNLAKARETRRRSA